MTKLQNFLNSPISTVSRLQRAPKVGDLFGIELECEGRNLSWAGDDNDLLKMWAPHADGSLRAHHGDAVEWVFNGPVKYKASVERVNKLFDYFEKRKAKLVTSNRTSTHVHYNMGDKNAYQLVNVFILFTILEDLLDRYCGEDRRGNLFCLSSRHAEQQIHWVTKACFDDYSFMFKENQRYCSLNLASINKFGTIEFRGMRGLDNRADVLAWLDILNEFCDYACYKMKNPVDVITDISGKGVRGFLQGIFSRVNYDRLTAGLPDHVIQQSLYDGLRLVQMLCYKIGTEFDGVQLKGRDFWASFSEDEKPDLDIDPDLVDKAPAGFRRARNNGIFNNPGRINIRHDAIEAVQWNMPVNPVGAIPAEPDGHQARVRAEALDALRRVEARFAANNRPRRVAPEPQVGDILDEF